MPYRRTERIETRLADNRERILRAARDLIADGGFREAQVVAIAAAAGLATGTLYRYFPSKADLFAELLRAICERELAVTTSIANSGGPALTRIRSAVAAFSRRALRARRLAYAIIVEPVDPEVDQVRLEYRRAQTRVFASMIHDGIDAGELPRQDVEISAACLVGAFLEGLVSPLSQGLAPDDESAERLLAEVERFAVRAVSGDVIERASLTG
jgi:AcrR family transcriptional regulator